jgi:hypothetical protein
MRIQTFAISIAAHSLVLASFFVESVTAISFDVGMAAAITLALVGSMGVLKGFFLRHTDDLTYCLGAVVSSVLFTVTVLSIKWGIDNPVRDPPPLSRFLEHVFRREPLWVVAPIIAITVFASTGVLAGRGLHQRLAKERIQ